MIKVTVTKNLIAMEDLLLGTGTEDQVRGPIGSDPVTVTEINGAIFPYDDEYSMSEKIDDLQAQIDSLPIVVDPDGHVLIGYIFSSAVDLDLEDRLWRKTIDANTAELYWYDELLFQYDPTNGGLLPYDDRYIAADAVIQAQIDAFGDVVAYDVGTDAGDIVQLDGSAKLPAVDGSQLTNLPFTMPVGLVLPYTGATAPTNYAICDGAELDRTTYATLFALIGTTYGIGDGSTTFNIPDLRGEFIRGNDNGRGIDSGRVLGSNQSESYTAHTHDGSALTASSGGTHTHTIEYDRGTTSGSNTSITKQFPSIGSDGITTYGIEINTLQADDATPPTDWTTESSGNHTHTITGSTGSTGGTETRPRNMSLNFIIRTL